VVPVRMPRGMLGPSGLSRDTGGGHEAGTPGWPESSSSSQKSNTGLDMRPMCG
jgi:hypothetical protein